LFLLMWCSSRRRQLGGKVMGVIIKMDKLKWLDFAYRNHLWPLP
jgi:hypothetical protein